MKELKDFVYQSMESITSQLQQQVVGEGYATQNMVDVAFKGLYRLNCQQILSYSF